MRTIVSVISHRHHDVIINMESIKRLAQMSDVVVICRDNDPVKHLAKYCEKYGIIYIPNEEFMGFSANMNANFKYYQENLNPQSDDRYLILNPDVWIRQPAFKTLLKTSEKKPDHIIAANLFLDKEFIFQDDNIRRYPKFTDFLRTYLLNHRVTMIDKSKDTYSGNEVWASAACMLMPCSMYQTLGGFDEKFYMYCEDIDICRRARRQGIFVKLCASAKAVHFRRRDSKRFLTSYFFWHVMSVLRYSLSGKSVSPKYTRVRPEPPI